MRKMFCLCLAALVCSQVYLSFAEERPPERPPAPQIDAAEANNPLASIKSFSVHNIYTTGLYGMEAKANTAWLRYAQPLGRFLLRASLPINTISSVSNNISGLGDFNFFVTWIATKPTSRNQFGFGPIFSFPTATSPELGSGKWSAGLALVAYFVPDPQFQAGILATWQHSFAGNKNRKHMHLASFQPLLTWQLGDGLYLRSTGIIGLDFKNDSYFIPLGFGAGKVFRAGKATFNIFIEPQFTAYHYGNGAPEIQIFCGINTQF